MIIRYEHALYILLCIRFWFLLQCVQQFKDETQKAWFPVHLKNSHIKSVGKLRWKNHRRYRYVEEPNCLKTGKPKRIYNKEEDEDDPDAGDGKDNGEIAYDDYDYYEDENSTSNSDSIGYETSNAHSTQIEMNIHTLKEITLSETAGVFPTTVGDQPSIAEDIDLPSYYTTEGPLTDDTEEPTERRVPGQIRAHCRVRHHTYQNQKLELTTHVNNTILGTASSEYPGKTSTNIKVQTRTLNDEQLWQPSTSISTTEVKLKYYTDDYDDGVKNQKLESTTQITNTNVGIKSSAETSTYKVHTRKLNDEQPWETSNSISTTIQLKYYTDDYDDAVKNQKLDSTTQIKNTNFGTASFEYPAETFTYEGHPETLNNQQSWQTSSTISTTVKLKYYTDDYDDVVKNQKLESTTQIKNTNVGTASFENPAETSTYEVHTGTLTNEQSWKTSRSISTTTAKLKYYTDVYDDEVEKKQTDKLGIKSTEYPDRSDLTIGKIVSTTMETPNVKAATGNSNMYDEITNKKSFTDSTNIWITTSKNDEWPKTYHHGITPERLGMPSSSKDSNTFSDSVPNRVKTIYTVDISSTDEHDFASKVNDFTEERTEWVIKSSEPGEDYCLGYTTDNTNKQTMKSNCDIGDKGIDQSLTGTRLRHIETPPYPKLPVDLRFPTCSGYGDCLIDDILSPSSAPQKVKENNNEQKTEKNFEKKKEKSRKNRKHCRRKSTYLTTEMRSKTVPSYTTQHYVAKKLPGNKKDAKVVVRIPPSLSDIPVVVVRDPQTQKLSLSLIGAEQDPVQPKPIYYKPVLYHQMFPPPFSYNNLYSPNIPPFSKIYPYEYLYGPNMGYRYDKTNYIYPKRLRFYNNYRWIRDTYEDDEEDDEEKSTNSEWEIYLTV